MCCSKVRLLFFALFLVSSVVSEGCAPTQKAQLHQAWTSRVGTLELMCTLLPWCGGFTSRGMLFMTRDNVEGASGGADCYLKRNSKSSSSSGGDGGGLDSLRGSSLEEISQLQQVRGLGNVKHSPAEKESIEKATLAIASGMIIVLGCVAFLSLATYLLFVFTRSKKLK